MIRINLAVERARPKVKRRVAVPGGVFLVIVLIIALLGVGALAVHGYILDNQQRALEEEQNQLKAKEAELASMKKQITEFEAKKSELDNRIKVIETLRANQTGPARLLESIADTVSATETLWLTNMTDRGGGQIELKGMAGSVDAVANFITNLSRSNYFKSVEIKESVQKTPPGGGPANFEFTLTATFAVPTATPATPAEPAAAQPAAAPPRRT